MKDKYVYVAFKKCGCVAGGVADNENEDVGESVKQFIDDGCYINRVTVNGWLKVLHEKGFGCECGEKTTEVSG